MTMVLSSLADVEALIGSRFEEENVYGSTNVQLDCLLPTGIYIPLTVGRWTTVREVKQILWQEAAEYPLFEALMDADNYVFIYINSFSERQEITDEERVVSAIEPFLSVLKVIKRETRNLEKDIDSQVGALIGKHDFESLRDEEIIEFRRESKQLCDKINEEKSSVSDPDRVISFLHPPDICEDVDLYQRVTEVLVSQGGKFFLEIPHTQHNGNCGTHRLMVSAEQYPEDVIHNALVKQRQGRFHQSPYDHEEYVLKIVGREEYLLPDSENRPRPLYKYTYIYRCIMKGEPPRLTLLKKTDVTRPLTRQKTRSASVSAPPRPPKNRKNPPRTIVWDISEKFSFEVVGASQINCDTDSTVLLKAAIYHGVETLCEMQDTPGVLVVDNCVEFNHNIFFDMAVSDLPRMSRLCLALYVHTHKNKKKISTMKAANNKTEKRRNKSVNEFLPYGKDYAPLAWVNMCVFDFKARLAVGRKTLNMWSSDESTMLSDAYTNHLGTVVNNPHKDASIALNLKFSHYGQEDKPIVYPPLEIVIDCAAKEMGDEREYGTIGKFDLSEEEAVTQLNELLDNRDPLHTFPENDKEKMWSMRLDISSKYRESLPRLLSCVRWNIHTDVAQMQTLLQSWPVVSMDTSLELLDCMYPDERVRNFAVSCLRDAISDTDLCRYLLQLVQALKFESYLSCDLVKFLLERALNNRKVGHYLFWLLKSEMHVASVSVRFGLILEAYCRGSIDHVAILRNQEDIVSKLLAINRLVKSSSESKEKAIESMRQVLSGYMQSEAFGVVTSPLDPALRLSTLRVDKCRFMDSKMKPLWLVWENGDRYGDDIKIIFKNGDDLRQDMLTIQILHIMDNIWISQGLDLRLNPYDCLSTGRDVGMLQVVQNANTIANIQKLKVSANIKSAFNKEGLYSWLQDKNPDPASLQRAVEEFTLSCAGYCVASYVLGIGDRHSDNIMLKQSGQLFHIDFGHILGNFKSKYGIRRERVPFVLANDFIYIIEKNTTKKHPFEAFRKQCEEAYLLLRKKGTLLISLFMMMLSTGLPELRTVGDLRYLQETLKLDVSDEMARKHFRSKFKEAIKNSWTTSVNWAIHNLAKDN